MSSPASSSDVVAQLNQVIAQLTTVRDALKGGVGDSSTSDSTGVPKGPDGLHDPNALLRAGLGHRTAS